MNILEFLGMFFSIFAVLYIAKATNEAIYKANVLFYISNIMMFSFFFLNGIVSIFIQMGLFFITAILGILRLSKNKQRDKKIILITSIIYITIFSFYLNYIGLKDLNFEIKPLDTIASIMAIIGAFLLSYDSFIKRNIAYILFLLADILYIYIGYSNGFYFFMIQSIFYIFTSSIGIKNNIKLNKSYNY